MDTTTGNFDSQNGNGEQAQTYTLELRNITKSYPGALALNNVDFNVRPGEVHVLLGENGAGKSTLIKIIAGAEQRDEGDLYLNGNPVSAANPAQMRRMGISVIYQELSVVPKMDVVSNIFLGREWTVDHFLARAFGIRDSKRMEAFCRELLDDLNIDIPPKTLVQDLSVSEMQLIEIARAVAFNAHLILMDEPTTSLGPTEKERLFQLIGHLKERGIAIVYVSHILEDCMALGDRITVLRDGEKIATVTPGNTDIDALVHMMTGRSFEKRYPEITSKPGEKVLEVRGLSLSGKFHDVSFDLHEGEIIAFSGLVGAGRTEVMHALFGLDNAETGDIKLLGKPVSIKRPGDAVQRGFSLLTEDRKTTGILPNMTISDNIVVTVLNLWANKITRGLVRFGQILRFRQINDYVRRFIDEIRVKTASPQSLIVQLSGGNQQKALIARALSADARIMILDEPTKGVDAGAKVEIYGMLQALVERNIALIIVSSELPEVMALGNRIIVMREGRVAANLLRSETSVDEVAQYATR
jgi:ribose transport system ATP-binding protein